MMGILTRQRNLQNGGSDDDVKGGGADRFHSPEQSEDELVPLDSKTWENPIFEVANISCPDRIFVHREVNCWPRWNIRVLGFLFHVCVFLSNPQRFHLLHSIVFSQRSDGLEGPEADGHSWESLARRSKSS